MTRSRFLHSRRLAVGDTADTAVCATTAAATRRRPPICTACGGGSWLIARIFNLPYRRIVFHRALDRSHALALPKLQPSLRDAGSFVCPRRPSFLAPRDEEQMSS